MTSFSLPCMQAASVVGPLVMAKMQTVEGQQELKEKIIKPYRQELEYMLGTTYVITWHTHRPCVAEMHCVASRCLTMLLLLFVHTLFNSFLTAMGMFAGPTAARTTSWRCCRPSWRPHRPSTSSSPSRMPPGRRGGCDSCCLLTG